MRYRLRTLLVKVAIMSHVISRLYSIAGLSLLTLLFCPCGKACAQRLKASGRGEAAGPFLGPGLAGAGSLQLGLKIGLLFEGNLSPALFYAISHPAGEEKRFA